MGNAVGARYQECKTVLIFKIGGIQGWLLESETDEIHVLSSF
jgi:hypothetical protein